MLNYEFKKTFGIKKCIALLILLSTVTCFFTFIMCRISSYFDYGIIPFEEYLSFFWLYGMATLYIIIFVQVPIFPLEEKTAMSQILMISKYGRDKLVKTKITLGLLVTNILVLLCIVSSLFGYAIAFSMNFKIPIIEDYNVIYTIKSSVSTTGDILFNMMIALALVSNFTALFSMFLSIKLKNTYLVYILLFIGYFMTLFSLNPVFGTFFAIMPFGNYILIADTLKVLFTLGSFPITLHSISLVVTFILICILFAKLISLHKKIKD